VSSKFNGKAHVVVRQAGAQVAPRPLDSYRGKVSDLWDAMVPLGAIFRLPPLQPDLATTIEALINTIAA